ncbi:hypothetical protein DW322_16365 [Rhodococcus rhodnii]|uniref:Uncharacterized protein n=2 Tax=Rhodococcus rhodnii TaxID=38312 RepID=R7WKC9_9NOCA|nr:hypothetical protein [Rhodococcus rhodnii]EOM75771.1 hypothetical protein Rrhod_2887 [Rhodococcus rhodnii LMG 5362]TXG91486.1 hypothetical protein DW322_16365 [Rhodococcus rhodnii]
MPDFMRENYDIAGTAATGAVLWSLHAPWPLWLVWCGIIAFIVYDRTAAARQNRDHGEPAGRDNP